MNAQDQPLSCPRCGSTLPVQRPRPSVAPRLRVRRITDLPCGRCGWKSGDPEPPNRASVGSGVFRCGSVTTSDVGSLRYEQLTARDAAELAAIASSPPEVLVARDIASALDWFRRTHGSAAASATPASWHLIDAAEVPWWCWFRDAASLFVPLGPDACRDITAMTSVAIHQIIESHPGATVARSSARSGHDDYRKPVVLMPDGRELSVIYRFVVVGYKIVVPWERPDLDTFVDSFSWVGRPDTAAVRAARSFDIEFSSDGCTVIFDDVVAHEAEARISALVRQLAAMTYVERVNHEDREVIEIGTDHPAEVGRWIEEWWRANAE